MFLCITKICFLLCNFMILDSLINSKNIAHKYLRHFLIIVY
jgi:hypothetical protein